jgi:hypothetical protein
LIKRLAKIKEEQGKIDEAADLMQEIAVSLHCTKIEDMQYVLLSSVAMFHYSLDCFSVLTIYD